MENNTAITSGLDLPGIETMMSPLWLLVIVCTTFMAVNCQHGEEMKTYCGGNLVTALSLVCRGKYRALIKKDNVYDDDDDNMPVDDYIYNLLDKESRWPLFPLLRPHSLTGKLDIYRRLRRGVVQECCEKACTHNDMLRYCE